MSQIINSFLQSISTPSGFYAFIFIIMMAYGGIWYLFLFESMPNIKKPKKVESEEKETKEKKKETKEKKKETKKEKGEKTEEKKPAEIKDWASLISPHNHLNSITKLSYQWNFWSAKAVLQLNSYGLKNLQALQGNNFTCRFTPVFFKGKKVAIIIEKEGDVLPCRI